MTRETVTEDIRVMKINLKDAKRKLAALKKRDRQNR